MTLTRWLHSVKGAGHRNAMTSYVESLDCCHQGQVLVVRYSRGLQTQLKYQVQVSSRAEDVGSGSLWRRWAKLHTRTSTHILACSLERFSSTSLLIECTESVPTTSCEILMSPPACNHACIHIGDEHCMPIMLGACSSELMALPRSASTTTSHHT